MKDPKNLIDRFCFQHPHFGIPNLMRYIAIANVVFWLFGMFNAQVFQYLSFSPALIFRGQVWRLISFIFYPPGTSIISIIAIYFYFWIGSTLEQYWGTAQFNIYFFTGVILTVLYGLLMYLIIGYCPELSAQYIFLSMFFSFACLFPDMQVLLFFIIPVKMKWLALLDAAFFAWGFVRYLMCAVQYHSAGYVILAFLPVIAVLNFLLFCGGDLLRRRPRRPSAQTVNFRRESARIRREQEKELYHHKCAVCGRTDTDYPTLEFRYCSRCAGYHCFCQDHINSHIHFTE